VLRRVVVTNATGAITEDLAYGYDGPGDSPAYQIPTPSSWGWPTTLADTWPALQDAPWNPARWDTNKSGTATIETENTSGELYVSGSSDARVAARGPQHGDAEVTLTFQFSNLNNRSGFRTGLRGCSTTPTCNSTPMNSGYRIDVVSDQSTVSVRRVVGGSHTTIGSFSFSKTANTNYRLRYQLSGYTISVKLWKATDPEPGTWTYTVTDTDTTNRIGGTGRLHLHHNGTNSSRSVFVDDLTLRVPAPTQSASTKTYIGGPDGLLVIDDNGTPTYPLANGHGDIAGTTNAGGTYTANPTTDEFGIGTTPANRLGWRGAHQRFATGNGANVIRMGVRLYDPSLGRFLQTDPVAGGSANDYDYVNGDPLNGSDLNGACDVGTKKCIMALLTTGTERFSDAFLRWGERRLRRTTRNPHARYIIWGTSNRRGLMHGTCSGPTFGFNFTIQCQTHDLGYDLMRYYGTSGRFGSIRRAVDWLLSNDMRARCWSMGGSKQFRCIAAEQAVSSGVSINSTRQGFGVP